jgi:site-specific DNA recombinase
MKRVALYARVSSDRQEREETIDSQLAQLRSLAEQKQAVVLDRHVYLDDGYSGDLLARPGLDRLRDDAHDGLFDLVLVHCPDRLARRYAYQVVVGEELLKSGCELDFVNRAIAQTPEDQMLLAMQGVIAEYERAKIMERTRRGRLYKLRAGVLVISQAPIGYRWIPRQGADRGRLEIVAEQADLVRQIFRWVADEGLTVLGVSRRLMERGVPAPKGGVRWGASTIQNLLKNRAYVGEFCLNRIMAVEPTRPPQPGVYRRKRKCAQRTRPSAEWIVVPGPSLISRELYEAAQSRLAANKRFALRRAQPGNRTLLRCLLRCGVCGYSIIATWSQPRGPKHQLFRYYVCIKHAQQDRYGDPKTRCDSEPIKAEVLDDIVWSDLRAVMSDPERIARYAGLEQGPTRQPARTDIHRIMREIEGCDRQLQRLVDAYQRGAVEMDDLVARRKQIDARRALLVDERKEVETSLRDDEGRRAIRDQLPELARNVRSSLETADFETRVRLVRLLIDRIVVDANFDLEIHYVLPASGRSAGPANGDGGTGRGTGAGPDPRSLNTHSVSSDLRLHSETQSHVAPRLRSPEHPSGEHLHADPDRRPLAVRRRSRGGRGGARRLRDRGLRGVGGAPRKAGVGHAEDSAYEGPAGSGAGGEWSSRVDGMRPYAST